MIRRFAPTAALLLGLSASAALAQTIDIGTNFMSFYAAEDRRIAVKLADGITSTDQLLSEELRQGRKDLAAKRKVDFVTMRRLADLGEGNAAFQLAKRMNARPSPERMSDIAHYFGIAAATGRGGAISSFVEALDSLDPETASAGRLRNFKYILVSYAAKGNSIAADAMIRFHQTGRPFGSLNKDLNRIVLQRGGAAAGPLALMLANDILQNPSASVADLKRAKIQLSRAEKSGSLRVKVTALNLLPVVDQMIQDQISVAEIEEIKQ